MRRERVGGVRGEEREKGRLVGVHDFSPLKSVIITVHTINSTINVHSFQTSIYYDKSFFG